MPLYQEENEGSGEQESFPKAMQGVEPGLKLEIIWLPSPHSSCEEAKDGLPGLSPSLDRWTHVVRRTQWLCQGQE